MVADNFFIYYINIIKKLVWRNFMPLFVTNQDIETLDFDLFVLFDCKYLNNFYEKNTFDSKKLSEYLKYLNNGKKINRFILLDRKVEVLGPNQRDGTIKEILGKSKYEKFNKEYLNLLEHYNKFYSEIYSEEIDLDKRKKLYYKKIVTDPNSDSLMKEMEKVTNYLSFNTFLYSLPNFQYDEYCNKQFVSPYYKLNEEKDFFKPNNKSVLFKIYKSIINYAEENNFRKIAIPILYSENNSNQFYIDKSRRIIRKILNDKSDDYTVYLLLTNTDNNYYLTDGIFREDLTDVIPSIREDIDKTYSVESSYEEEFDDEESSVSINCCMSFEARVEPRGKRELDRLIKDRLKNKIESFSEMVMRKIKEKCINKVDCYKAANVNKNIFSKITKEIQGDENQDGSPYIYHPDKKIVLAFTIALKLNRSEAEELMNKAGFAFTNSPLDVIVQIFIDKEIYDIDFVNQYLFKYKQPLLGTTIRE